MQFKKKIEKNSKIRRNIEEVNLKLYSFIKEKGTKKEEEIIFKEKKGKKRRRRNGLSA